MTNMLSVMNATRWLEPHEQHAWRAYLEATRLLVRTLDNQLIRDAGISFSDFELLVVLSEAPERRLRMSELADAVTTTRSGVTRATSRLVDAGWVVRVAAVRENMFDLLSVDDVDAIGRGYQRMREHMSGRSGTAR